MPVLGDWPLMLHDEVVQLDGDYHSFIYRISPAGKAAMLSQHQSRLLSSCRRNVHDMSVWYGSFEFWCTGEWQLDIWTLFFLQECLSQHSCSQSCQYSNPRQDISKFFNTDWRAYTGIILWAGRREDWGRNYFALGTPWELLIVMGRWTAAEFQKRLYMSMCNIILVVIQVEFLIRQTDNSIANARRHR